MVNQNPKFESPNSGPNHRASLEHQQPNITSLHHFKPPLFDQIQKALNFEIRNLKLRGRDQWAEQNWTTRDPRKITNCKKTKHNEEQRLKLASVWGKKKRVIHWLSSETSEVEELHRNRTSLNWVPISQAPPAMSRSVCLFLSLFFFFLFPSIFFCSSLKIW